jgi:hypothetical protein
MAPSLRLDDPSPQSLEPLMHNPDSLLLALCLASANGDAEATAFLPIFSEWVACQKGVETGETDAAFTPQQGLEALQCSLFLRQ